MAVGASRISGLLEGADVLATAAALRALGVDLARHGDGVWEVHGVGIGGLAEADRVLDLGNAGTGARLLLGLLAGHPFPTFFTGDASLRARPMARVITPLQTMGARFLARSGSRLPVAVVGTTELLPIRYPQPVASAQVKSAVLLAGLHAAGRTTVVEPQPSRDHTERLLRHLGVEVEVADQEDGTHAVSVLGSRSLRPPRSRSRAISRRRHFRWWPRPLRKARPCAWSGSASIRCAPGCSIAWRRWARPASSRIRSRAASRSRIC